MFNTRNSSDFNRDFYAFCPTYYLDRLENIVKKYSGEAWFEKAWKEYADIASSKPMRDIPEPNSWFSAFVSEPHTESEGLKDAMKTAINSMYGSINAKNELDEEESDFVKMAETDFDSFYEDDNSVITSKDFEDYLIKDDKD